MPINPIPYSAFIAKDNSLQELIETLESVKSTYEALTKTVVKDANTLKSALTSVSVATKDGQKETDVAAEAAKRLAKVKLDLSVATSEAGAEIQKYKEVLRDVNKHQSESAKINVNATNSVTALKAELGKLVKTYEDLSGADRDASANAELLRERILTLREAIKAANDEIKISTKVKKDDVQATTPMMKALERLNELYTNESKELREVNRQVTELLKIRKQEDIVNNTIEGSYDNLSARYNLAKIELNKYSQAVIDSSKFLTNMQGQAKAMRMEMIRLQEATGHHALKVGDYGRAWNGLGVSVQQVFRELPVLAVSWNTFFLAISNNLPILADEINKVVSINKQMKADGKEVTSLTKQLGAAVFSMQTVLILAVTALTLYGGKMVKWVQDTFAAGRAAMTFEKALKAVNKELRDSDTTVGAGATKFRTLQEAWKRAEGDLVKQERLVKDNQAAFAEWGVSIDNVNDAQRLFVDQSATVLEVMRLQARASAAAELASKAYQEEFKQQLKFDEQQAKGPNRSAVSQFLNQGATSLSAGTRLDSNMTPEKVLENSLKSTQKQIDKNKEEGDSYFNLAEAASAAARAKLTAAGFTLDEDKPDKDKPDKDTKEPKGPSDLSIEQANLRIRKAYYESLSALERDEFKQRRLELQDQYRTEVEDLQNKLNNDEKLNDESKGLISKIIINKQKKLNHDLEILNIDQQQRVLDVEKETLELRLDASEQGTLGYFDTRKKLLQNQMQFEILENKKLVETQQQSEEDIRAKYHQTALRLQKSEADEMYRIIQDFQAAEFNSIRQSEYNKNKFVLEQERDRWERRLQLAKAGLLELTDLEIKTAENIIKGINVQLSDLSKSKDVYDLMGFNLNNSQKQSISESYGFIKGQISDMIQMEIDLADAKLERANDQMDKAYQVLLIELEARSKGYANQVETAEKELTLARMNQAQALADKQKALKAQQALDMLEQTSSLITASANIWKSFSPLGPIGVAAAIAAIGTMFGVFTSAKIRASKVPREQSELYRDGHVELLRGGSHASGKDISLGHTPDGRERRAEGGEVFAVINKRSTDRYGTSKIFDIMNSLNRGEFEDKYTNIFNRQTVLQSPELNLGGLEGSVEAIRANTEYKYYKDGSGKVVEKYKNRTRTFKT